MSPSGAELAETVARLVREVPDFPEPGILFRDITPLLADGPAFHGLIESWALAHAEVDVVVGVEARGFILAAPLATRLGIGFVPVRKAGKLPGRTERAAYALEYGQAVLEVTHDAIRPGQRVVLIDDVLATGGTAAAAAQLVEGQGGVVVAIQVLMELAALGGRQRLADRAVLATLVV